MQFNLIKDSSITSESNVAPSVSMQEVQEYKMKLRQSPEVIAIKEHQIDLANGNSIVNYGDKPAQGISTISDSLLTNIKRPDIDTSGEMIGQLTKLIKKFDISEVEKLPSTASPLERVFNTAKKKIDRLLAKYEDLGKEVNEISNILMKNQVEIEKSNQVLHQLMESNNQYYNELEKYIVAGEMALEEIDDYTNQLQARTDMSEEEKQLTLQKLNLSRNILDKRVYDLRLAEALALQTAPMLASMQWTNYNLMLKIKSAGIITLPAFKRGIIQAVELKRQTIVSKSLQDLDNATNELILKNSQNTANLYIENTRRAGESLISIDALKESYQTIQNSLGEARRISEEQAKKRITDTQQLEVLTLEMKKNASGNAISTNSSSNLYLK